MRIVYFTHSLRSCWNHGNAHFLRGVLRALMARGHEVVAWEPEDSWSVDNLLRDHGPCGLEPFDLLYPELAPVARLYGDGADLEELVDGADLVLVHEWNEPEIVAGLGRLRARGASFTLLFHDTHHRAVSAPEEIREYDLDSYDGVLAFGEALAEVYRRWGWGDRVFVWHEAADIRLFRPPAKETEREGIVWIGNWGEGERTAEIEEYLLHPAREAGLKLRIHGVRYPAEALRMLARYGAEYHGWAPNPLAPALFGRALATIHVPRRFYVEALPGIPTIRVFEALACGIPLLCAPWEDAENLFRPGQDYLIADGGDEMARHLAALRADPEMREVLAASGRAVIEARHTCGHRADELLEMHEKLRPSPFRGEGGRDAVAARPGEGLSLADPCNPSPSRPAAGPLPLPSRERERRNVA